MRLFGRWTPTIDPQRATDLIREGAQLVDVRDPDEFARGHLPTAVNVPLGTIQDQLDVFQGRQTIVYCASGLRSQSALGILSKHDLNVHNLGAMSNYEEAE